ncbi:dihydrolipoyl dehydrogenase family protein [Weissella halotolerans]|nr:NAD(P)/FAD-dependent oxidoreductase [Weissella halotolerans]
MTQYDFDVLYLGSGHGTFDGAIPLAAKGVKVGVIEADRVGGTCPNWGCNAKISLDAPVALQRALLATQGTVAGSGKIDWAKNQSHKHSVIDGIPNFLEGAMESQGIKMIFGRGELVDAHTIQVAGTAYTADKIVIATGMHPHRLNIPGRELLHDSTDFLALAEMPSRMVIIGGGYIALESATMANAAGSDVTVVMHHQQALRAFHQPFVELMLADLVERGVTILRDTEAKRLDTTAEGIQVETSADTLLADWVLDATGRVPNTEGIGLETVGVETSPAGVKVNDYLQTSVPNIYASGDVIAKTQPKLTPTAVFESKYLMHRFSGDSQAPIDYPVIATNVYTSPRIAQAGITVDQAKANPDQYVIVENEVAADWYRQVFYETAGKTTLIFNQEHQLVGATEVSEQAEDVINSLLPAIEFGYTPAQMERLVHIFPSISADAWGQL